MPAVDAQTCGNMQVIMDRLNDIHKDIIVVKKTYFPNNGNLKILKSMSLYGIYIIRILKCMACVKKQFPSWELWLQPIFAWTAFMKFIESQPVTLTGRVLLSCSFTWVVRVNSTDKQFRGSCANCLFANENLTSRYKRNRSVQYKYAWIRNMMKQTFQGERLFLNHLSRFLHHFILWLYTVLESKLTNSTCHY